MTGLLPALGGTSDVETQEGHALCPLLQGVLGVDSFRAGNEDHQWQAFFQSGLPAAVELQAEIHRVKGLYDAACTAAGDEEGGDPLFAIPDEGFGMEADNDGKKVRIKKLHKRIFNRFSSNVRRRSSKELRKY